MLRTSPRNRFRRPSLSRLAAPVALVALFVAGLPLLSEPASAAEIPVVGTLPRFPDDSVAALGNRIKPTNSGDYRGAVGGTLFGVQQRNELWQMYPTDASNFTAAPTVVAVRDLTTLKLTRTLVMPLPAIRGANAAPAGDWMHAFDGDRRVFFLSGHNLAGGASWAVMEVDLRTSAQRVMELGPPLVVGGRQVQGLRPAGMHYDPHSDSLILMFGGVPVGAGAFMMLLYRLDLKPNAGASPVNSRMVRTCNGSQTPIDFGRTSQYGAIITQEYVYWACQRAGNIGAVVRIKRTQLWDPSSPEDIVAGPAYLDTALADPVSGRIFLVTIASEIWAFDTDKMAFVGVVAGGSEGGGILPTAYGLDADTGRLFIQSPVIGLGVAEGRFSPIPQARAYRELRQAGQERILSDARTGRAFVLTGTGPQRASAYTIYDVGRAPLPPPPPDPDRNTTDIDERAGVTDARYFGSGNGYGIRTLLAKGITAVPPAPTAGQQAPTADVFNTRVNSKCGYTDRELVVGRVAKAEYDTGSTAANAVGVDVDERTKLDLERLSRCDVAVPSAAQVFSGIFSTSATPTCDQVRSGLEKDKTCDSGHQWDTIPAYCTSSSGGEKNVHSPSEQELSGNNKGEVSCPEPGGDLTARAVGYLTGAVSVGRAETTTTITGQSKGIRSTVTALAQDIEIAGGIHIGEVVATAVSHSTGRPSKKPLSTYELKVKGVTLTTGTQTVVLCDQFHQVVGGTQKSDAGKNCDIQAAFGVLNTALAGRGEFRLSSGLDDGLLQGTKRGALTAVQKSTARQASDQALVGDRSNEVAGIELVVYNDNVIYGRARQIYQFAGVASAATYNITVLPTGSGFDDEGSFDESDLSPTGGLGGDFLDASGGLASVLPPTSSELASSSEDDDGEKGGFGPVLRALARGIRMFFTNPRHALLLLTAWALFSLPPVLARRRRLLALARSD